MQSKAHAAIGAVVSAPLVAWLWPDAGLATGLALWAYGAGLSVVVDVDHFLVSRLSTGDWRHLRRVLDRPTDVVWDQSWIFPDEDLLERQRLLSHALVGGVLVAGVWSLAPTLAVYSAIVLYVHVLADLLRDNRLL